jgi:uncharacterized membrane protein
MLFRLLALLCAAAMLASPFLTWLVLPSGEGLGPWHAIRGLNGDQLQDLVRTAPPAMIAFIGSFVLAAVFVLMALIGRETRTLAFLTGLVPVGLVAWVLISASNRVGFSNLHILTDGLSQGLAAATDVVGPGPWAWIGSAVLLLLLGLFDPGRRKT